MQPQAMPTAPLSYLRWDGKRSDQNQQGGGASLVVVLLHGIGGGREAWGDALSRTGLALADAGFDVLAPDLPGYGASPISQPLTIAAMAQAVLALVAWAGYGRCVVVGHSMGGMVAQEMVVQETVAQEMVAQEMVALSPQRVAGLVLSGTSPAFGKPDGDWQERFLRDRLKPLDEGQGMAALSPKLARAMCAPGVNESRLAFAAQLMATVPEATYRAALRALMGFDRRNNLARLAMPVLVLAGEHDPNASPAVMQGMAQRITGAEYLCLPAVGHLANIEAPEAFNNAVAAFVLRHFPARQFTSRTDTNP